jgi:hypothetical protein
MALVPPLDLDLSALEEPLLKRMTRVLDLGLDVLGVTHLASCREASRGSRFRAEWKDVAGSVVDLGECCASEHLAFPGDRALAELVTIAKMTSVRNEGQVDETLACLEDGSEHLLVLESQVRAHLADLRRAWLDWQARDLPRVLDLAASATELTATNPGLLPRLESVPGDVLASRLERFPFLPEELSTSDPEAARLLEFHTERERLDGFVLVRVKSTYHRPVGNHLLWWNRTLMEAFTSLSRDLAVVPANLLPLVEHMPFPDEGTCTWVHLGGRDAESTLLEAAQLAREDPDLSAPAALELLLAF